MSDYTQTRLLRWVALFLFLFSLILTLAPAVRERTWDVDYRLAHWIGFIAWALLTLVAHRVTVHYLPEHDPYLLPAAALLSGWGLLTIWRLDETFGVRQTIWLGISVLIFSLVIALPESLSFFRRYKYVLLSGGLLITALTLLFGTNPLGVGPRLWLGCCGVYRIVRPNDAVDRYSAAPLNRAAGPRDCIDLHIYLYDLPVPGYR